MIGSRVTVGLVMLGIGCAPPPPKLDVDSPKVVSVLPADGATDISPISEVVICFDRPMDPATATSENVLLSRDDGHRIQPLSITLSLSTDATCVTASPWSPLAPASHHRLELEKGLLSASGIEIGSKATNFSSGFTTQAPAATAALLIPWDGMLSAPLDLSQVLIAFSAPVSVADGGPPFALIPTPPNWPGSELSPDGLLARGPFPGAASGTQVSVALSPALVDASGQLPLTGGWLGFTMGSCSEGSPPSLGEGLVLARDSDAILSFAVDRPSLCSVTLADPGCPDAGGLDSPAQCQAPYDPCQPSLLCLCDVALVGLCPGDSVQATPQAVGFDGQVGAAAPVAFQTSPLLPELVLTEVKGGAKSGAFVEVQNRASGPIDLLGMTLADCALTLGCSSPKTSQRFGSFGGLGSTVLAPNGYALLVDPTFDPSSAPVDALLLSPQGQGSLMSLSETHAQSLALFSPSFPAVVSSYDGSVLPQTGLSLERIDPASADPFPRNWSISLESGGTPGACNSVTSGALCDAPLGP